MSEARVMTREGLEKQMVSALLDSLVEDGPSGWTVESLAEAATDALMGLCVGADGIVKVGTFGDGLRALIIAPDAPEAEAYDMEADARLCAVAVEAANGLLCGRVNRKELMPALPAARRILKAKGGE